MEKVKLCDPVKAIENTKISTLRDEFNANGHISIENLVDESFICELNDELVKLSQFNFEIDKSLKQPDKIPSKKSLEFYLNPVRSKQNNIEVCQWINIWKSSTKFKSLVHSKTLGKLVSQLCNYKVRVAQDQVWVKPPNSKPLVFHKDSPYFFFKNPKIITVWVALTDMTDENGALEYVTKSHFWKNDEKIISKFFQNNIYKQLHQAAIKNEKNIENLQFCSMSGLKKGSISIHFGNLWHGSKSNESQDNRIGIGIHYIAEDNIFLEKAKFSKLWKKFCYKNDNFVSELNSDFFPKVSDELYENYG